MPFSSWFNSKNSVAPASESASEPAQKSTPESTNISSVSENVVDNSISNISETDKIINYLINLEKILHNSNQILNKTFTNLSDEEAQKRVETKFLGINLRKYDLKTAIGKIVNNVGDAVVNDINQTIIKKIKENTEQIKKLINNTEVQDILEYRNLLNAITLEQNSEDADYKELLKTAILKREYDTNLTKTYAAWKAYTEKKGGSNRKTRKHKKSKKARKSRKH